MKSEQTRHFMRRFAALLLSALLLFTMSGCEEILNEVSNQLDSQMQQADAGGNAEHAVGDEERHRYAFRERNPQDRVADAQQRCAAVYGESRGGAGGHGPAQRAGGHGQRKHERGDQRVGGLEIRHGGRG